MADDKTNDLLRWGDSRDYLKVAMNSSQVLIKIVTFYAADIILLYLSFPELDNIQME